MTRSSLFRSGSIVTLGILLGRAAGFARDLLIAHYLGSDRAADLAVFTLTLPDVFTNLLIGGAMGAALIPEFQTGSAKALLRQASVVSFAAFGALALAVIAAGALLVRLLAPGIGDADLPLARSLILGSAVVIPITAATAVSTAFLQSFQRYGVWSIGTLLMNGVILAFLAWGVRPDSLQGLAIGASLGAALRWISQLADAAWISRAEPPSAAAGWRVTRPLLTRYAQALGSSAFLLLVPVAARALASALGPGAFASMNYAFRLSELPLGFVLPVLTALLLPRFSKLFAEQKDAEALDLARRGFWLIWILTLPIAFAMVWFRHPIVSLVFGHGRMNPDAVAVVADLSAWSVATIPAQGLAALFFSILSARKDTRRALIATVAGFAAYVPLAWIGRQYMGQAGIMAASIGLHWGICLAYGGILALRHGMTLAGGAVIRDAAAAVVVAVVGVAPAALLLKPGTGEWTGTLLALGGMAAGLLASLAFPRTRAAMKAFH